MPQDLDGAVEASEADQFMIVPDDGLSLPSKVLVLGGTTEASRLARALAAMPQIGAMLSLAGRTRSPVAQPIRTRIGGFGGVEGLRAWLRAHETRCVIDATHPFAAQMSCHAAEACTAEGVARARFTRPPWQRGDGDNWTTVPDGLTAVAALGVEPRRVFLPLGRGSLEAFAAAPWHFYLVRSIDAPDDLSFLPHHAVISARPPFSVQEEQDLLLRERIETVVVKNSGGDVSAAKLAAARALRLPVVMIEQPAAPAGPVFYGLSQVLDFIARND